MALTLQSLIDRANALPHQSNQQYPRPTSGSIQRINAHFNIVLPHDFLEFVRCWRSSAVWFSSLGNDYESGEHIIRFNSYWRSRRRTRRLPANLVVFNRGFDDDCDAFDLSTYNADTGEYQVVYWTPGQEPRKMADTFLEYMNIHITAWEPRKKRPPVQS